LSELRGRIQKKVDITITAPFTEWQKLQEPVEEGKVEIVEPEINFETKGERTNRMRNEHNEWKRRADDIGVPQLPSGRPTKEALEEWHEEILLAEANYEG
jgi:hypothetical protein